MWTRVIQKFALYTKEVQDAGLFALMANSRIYAIFCSSPLYYILLPFMSLLLTLTAIINGYKVAKANNQNFDQWFNFITSLGCALLTTTSLCGLALAASYGFTFVAGPWIFLSSIALALLHQLVMLGLNAYSAHECVKGSAQRMHYVQAVLNNVYMMGLLIAATGAVICVMLVPVAPVVGTVFALTAVGLTLLNIGWRILPHHWKQFIKELLFLGKPDESIPPVPIRDALHIDDTLDIKLLSEKKHHRLFTNRDYKAEIKCMTLEDGEGYIKNVIHNKINSLQEMSSFGSDKNYQKISFLLALSTALTNHSPIKKADLLKKYPLAFQNFWSERGDVEQIYHAAKFLITKYQNPEAISDKVVHSVILSM